LRTAYFRDIDPARFLAFIVDLKQFVEESKAQGCDLEFML